MYQRPNLHPIAWFEWDKWEICLLSLAYWLIQARSSNSLIQAKKKLFGSHLARIGWFEEFTCS